MFLKMTEAYFYQQNKMSLKNIKDRLVETLKKSVFCKFFNFKISLFNLMTAFKIRI